MIKDLIAGLFKPVTQIFIKKAERKAARQAAQAKLAQAKVNNAHELRLNKDEWEAIAAKGLDNSWRDEYVTVSVVGILNIIVLGGLLAAFGYPQVLEGVGNAVNALSTLGVDISFLMEAAVLAGLGLSIWKRV